MNRDTINTLIEQIWIIETALKTALRTLSAIEVTIADEIED